MAAGPRLYKNRKGSDPGDARHRGQTPRHRSLLSRSSWCWLVAVLLTAACGATAPVSTPASMGTPDPLPSWNDTAAKKAIVDFVAKVTRPGSADYVPPPERIATFDNDGTLWSEKPVPFQLLFALDRVKALAAKHPQTGLPFTAMVYQPMLELLDYLRASGFKTFIVSGGGVEFMRPWTERVYGIPPEQVVGSAGKLKFEARDGEPVILKLPEVDLIDDKDGKPAAIQSRIGRRPIAAFGNSDGDLQMLQWTTAGPGARFALFVHHDDAAREYAYDRADKLQQFSVGWDEALARGWTVVSMKGDWKTVHPPENARR